MPDHKRPQQPQQGGGKPPSAPGISPVEVQQLRSRIEKLEKTVQEYLAEKNQWNSQVREWAGSQVTITLISGAVVTGELGWVDRYTICLKEEDGQPAIVHKGAIAVVRRGGPGAPP